MKAKYVVVSTILCVLSLAIHAEDVRAQIRDTGDIDYGPGDNGLADTNTRASLLCKANGELFVKDSVVPSESARWEMEMSDFCDRNYAEGKGCSGSRQVECKCNCSLAPEEGCRQNSWSAYEGQASCVLVDYPKEYRGVRSGCYDVVDGFSDTGVNRNILREALRYLSDEDMVPFGGGIPLTGEWVCEYLCHYQANYGTQVKGGAKCRGRRSNEDEPQVAPPSAPHKKPKKKGNRDQPRRGPKVRPAPTGRPAIELPEHIPSTCTLAMCGAVAAYACWEGGQVVFFSILTGNPLSGVGCAVAVP